MRLQTWMTAATVALLLGPIASSPLSAQSDQGSKEGNNQSASETSAESSEPGSAESNASGKEKNASQPDKAESESSDNGSPSAEASQGQKQDGNQDSEASNNRSPEARKNQSATSEDSGWQATGIRWAEPSSETLVIDQVQSDSMLAALGFQAGDRIVEVGDQALASRSDFLRRLRQRRAGSTPMTVVRDGKRRQFRLSGRQRRRLLNMVSGRPGDGQREQRARIARRPRYSEDSVEATQQEGGLGVSLIEGPAGQIFVSHIFQGSPAEQAGLGYGDQLIRVDGQDVGEVQQLVDYVRQQQPGSQLSLLFSRNGQLYETTATLESRQVALDRFASGAENTSAAARAGGRDSTLRSRVEQLEQEVAGLRREIRRHHPDGEKEDTALQRQTSLKPDVSSEQSSESSKPSSTNDSSGRQDESNGSTASSDSGSAQPSGEKAEPEASQNSEQAGTSSSKQ